MYTHEKRLRSFLLLSPASFAQIIKPPQTNTMGVNGTTFNSCTPTPNNEPEIEGTNSSPSCEGETLNDDEVYELEFGETTNLSEPRPRPVAKPRRRMDRTRHASAPGLGVEQNGLGDRRESVKGSESDDQHPTPSRSAPAPPNAVEATSNERVS